MNKWLLFSSIIILFLIVFVKLFCYKWFSLWSYSLGDVAYNIGLSFDCGYLIYFITSERPKLTRRANANFILDKLVSSLEMKKGFIIKSIYVNDDENKENKTIVRSVISKRIREYSYISKIEGKEESAEQEYLRNKRKYIEHTYYELDEFLVADFECFSNSFPERIGFKINQIQKRNIFQNSDLVYSMSLFTPTFDPRIKNSIEMFSNDFSSLIENMSKDIDFLKRESEKFSL